jgi:uncharacterized protein with FMN-binding domain
MVEMKLFLKIILSVVIVFILIVAGGMFYMTRGLDSGSKLVISQVDPSLLKDGTYNGKHSGGRWSNEVKVTVKDNKITKIDVVRDVAFSKPELTEALFNKVIKEQTTEVDVVSGSTVTCKAYLKAVESALKKE